MKSNCLSGVVAFQEKQRRRLFSGIAFNALDSGWGKPLRFKYWVIIIAIVIIIIIVIIVMIIIFVIINNCYNRYY